MLEHPGGGSQAGGERGRLRVTVLLTLRVRRFRYAERDGYGYGGITRSVMSTGKVWLGR